MIGSNTSTTLVASAAQRKIQRDTVEGTVGEGWQAHLWDIYAQLGPVHYGINFKRHSAEKIDYFIAEIDEDKPARSEDEKANEALDRLGDITGIVSEFVAQENVAGEGYLVGQERDDVETWDVWSTLEVRESQQARKKAPESVEPLSKDDFLLRVWRPSPKRRHEPDSPLRSVQQQCDQLLLLNEQIGAVAMSRLSAGVLLVPDELSFAKPADEDPDTGANISGDPFMNEIIDIMVEPIRDGESAARVAPAVVRGPKDYLEAIRHLTFGREIDQTFADMREELLRQIAAGLDLPPEIILGKADLNHWCVDEKTEALTRRGWVTHDDLVIGEDVLTLNHDSGLSEWKPITDIYRAEVENEDMVRMSTRNHSSLTTRNHRWPIVSFAGLRQFKRTSELTETQRLAAAAPHKAPTEPKWFDAHVELRAWYATEGSRGEGQMASIAQSHTVNPGNVARIRRALSELFGDELSSLRGLGGPGWRSKVQANESSHGGPVTVFYLNQTAADVLGAKRVEIGYIQSLTASQLRLFVDVFELGDGHHKQNNDSWQRVSKDLDAYELAWILLGRITNRFSSDGGHHLTAWKSSTTRPIKAHKGNGAGSVSTERYSGVVWCPVTDNGTWMMRRDGLSTFTGNSAWDVDESAAKLHVDPDVLHILDGLTRGYLWPTLTGENDQGVAMMSMEEAQRFIIWRDYSDLTSRPMSIDQAHNLAKDNIITGTEVRAVANLAPEKEPDLAPADIASRAEAVGVYYRAGFDPEAVLSVMGLPAIEHTGVAPVTVQSEADVDNVEPPPAGPDNVDRGPPALVASAQPLTGLADIDALLTAKIIEGAEAAAHRALERAGAKVRAKAKKDRELSALIQSVPNDKVTLTLGERRIEQLQVTADQLVPTDTFDPLAARLLALVESAQDETRVQLESLFGTDIEETTEEEDRIAAVDIFIAALIGLVVARLFTDSPDLDPAETGEIGDSIASGEIVFQLLTMAGGTLSPAAAGAATAFAPDSPRGLALGERTRALLKDHGYLIKTETWRYGLQTRRTNFEPHRELNGFKTDNKEHPDLRSHTSWLGVSHYFPGDHRGCLCSWVPSVELDLLALLKGQLPI